MVESAGVEPAPIGSRPIVLPLYELSIFLCLSKAPTVFSDLPSERKNLHMRAGGNRGIRTPATLVNSQLFCLLNYNPIFAVFPAVNRLSDLPVENFKRRLKKDLWKFFIFPCYQDSTFVGVRYGTFKIFYYFFEFFSYHQKVSKFETAHKQATQKIIIKSMSQKFILFPSFSQKSF